MRWPGRGWEEEVLVVAGDDRSTHLTTGDGQVDEGWYSRLDMAGAGGSGATRSRGGSGFAPRLRLRLRPITCRIVREKASGSGAGAGASAGLALTLPVTGELKAQRIRSTKVLALSRSSVSGAKRKRLHPRHSLSLPPFSSDHSFLSCRTPHGAPLLRISYCGLCCSVSHYSTRQLRVPFSFPIQSTRVRLRHGHSIFPAPTLMASILDLPFSPVQPWLPRSAQTSSPSWPC